MTKIKLTNGTIINASNIEVDDIPIQLRKVIKQLLN